MEERREGRTNLRDLAPHLGDLETSSRITLQPFSPISAAEPSGWICARQTEPRARSTAKGSTNVFQERARLLLSNVRRAMTEERPRALRDHILRATCGCLVLTISKQSAQLPQWAASRTGALPQMPRPSIVSGKDAGSTV